MPAKVNPTLMVLREIRDELKGLNKRVDGLNGRVDSLNDRVDTLNGRMEGPEQLQCKTERRLATELLGVVHAVNEVRDLLRIRTDVREKVDEHERRLAVVEQRLGI